MKFSKFILKAFLASVCGAFFSAATVSAQPANDDFANAETISGVRIHITRSNAAATKQAGEPNHAGNEGGKSVWFKWTAPVSAAMAFSTNLSAGNLDTLLHVYAGSELTNLSNRTSNNNISAPANLKSFTRTTVTAGTTYYIAVDGFKTGANAAAEGEFQLTIQRAFQFHGADFDVDGLTDLSFFRPSDGSWNYRQSVDGQTQRRVWGTSGDIPMAASISGSGRNEFAVFRPSDGTWYHQPICCSNVFLNWGMNGDVPVADQFGGSSGTQFGVFRPQSGEWFIYVAPNQYYYYQFGTDGDIPVPGQYSPDSYADIAVFRPSDGTWYFMKRQNANSNLDAFAAVQFGQAGDRPVPGDYDGDGILDVAVFRPSNGTWYVLRSSDAQFQAFQWGADGDVPTTGDFDGDGLFDYAVFRPSNGTWYVYRSSDGAKSINEFGQTGDIPLTANRTF